LLAWSNRRGQGLSKRGDFEKYLDRRRPGAERNQPQADGASVGTSPAAPRGGASREAGITGVCTTTWRTSASYYNEVPPNDGSLRGGAVSAGRSRRVREGGPAWDMRRGGIITIGETLRRSQAA